MELLDRLIRFTTIRPRSEFEIKRWLARKKISEEDSEVALRELKKAGLIDDEAFCRWWVEQRVAFRPKASRLLVIEIVKKGVDRELAQRVVGESNLNDEELAFSALNRSRFARQLISARGVSHRPTGLWPGPAPGWEKKKRSWERLKGEERKKKIVAFLQTRGFGWNVIRKFLVDMQ